MPPEHPAPNDLESQLAALESSAREDPESLARLAALLAEGHLRTLLTRIQTAQAEAEMARRAADRNAADSEDARRRLAEEEERLLKLWDAYKAQEAELAEARAETGRARAELAATQASMGATEARVAEKARELAEAEGALREAEARLAQYDALKGQVEEIASLRERAEEAEGRARAERDRLAKLYAAYEDLEAERDRLKKALDERTAWLEENKDALDALMRTLRKASPPNKP